MAKDGRIPLNTDELKKHRQRLGLSQDKLAEACQEQGYVVSISSIKRAESGANVLYRTAKNLAAFYGIPTEQLLLETELIDAGSGNDSTSSADQQTANLDASDEALHDSLSTKLVLTVKHRPLVDPAAVTSLLDNFAQTNTSIDGHIQSHWWLKNQDEYIFERLREQCETLLKTFSGQLKILLQACKGEVINEAEAVFEQLQWGDVAACPVFVTSDCFIPVNSTDTSLAGDCQQVTVVRSVQGGFVGRQQEKILIENAINQLTIQQRGKAICLSGMAGIGKTRLLTESLQHARTMSCQFSQLQLLNRGVVDTRAPVNSLVRALHEFSGDDDDQFIRRQMLLSTIPSQSQLIIYWLMGVELNLTEQRMLELMDYQTLQSAITESVKQVLNVRTKFPPRIICLEDMHWADEILMTVVESMLPDIQASNILLLMTFRQQNQLTERQHWFDQVDLLELTNLSEAEAMELAQQFYGPDGTVQKTGSADQNAMIKHCLEIAQGHPLYLRQSLLCAHLESTVPDSMEHLVAAQLGQLTAPDLEAIQAASVLGQCFRIDQLRFITNNPNFAPDQLLALGLIKHQGAQYMFHHDLICSAVLNQIPATKLLRLHKQCALWFKNKDPHEYAIHYQQSGAPDSATVLLDAAKQYMDGFQQPKALSLLEALLDKSAPAKASREQKARALNLKGQCLFAMGKVSDSIPALEAAIQSIERYSVDDPEHAKFLLDLATPYRMTDRIDQVIEVLDKAQTLAEQKHQLALLADIHSMRGNILFPTGDLDGCEREHQQSLAYADKLKDPDAKARARAKALGGLGDCAYAQAKMTSSYQYLQACLDLCTEHQLLKTEASNRFMLGTVLIYQLRFSDALTELQLASNLANLTANRRAEIVSRLTTGWILLDLGALDQAEQEINTAMAIAEQLQANRFVAFLLESKARLLWQQGKQQEAEQAIAHGIELVKENGMERFIGPWLCATQALVSSNTKTIEAALNQGEKWLESPCVGHNYLRFYQQGLQTAWQLQDAERMERYRHGLFAFTRTEPTPWADLYMERAKLMIGLIDQTASEQDVFSFNQQAETLGLVTAKIDTSPSTVRA